MSSKSNVCADTNLDFVDRGGGGRNRPSDAGLHSRFLGH